MMTHNFFNVATNRTETCAARDTMHAGPCTPASVATEPCENHPDGHTGV